MVLVRSTDSYVFGEWKVESTYGTDPDFDAGADRMPFKAEDVHFEDEILSETGEFIGSGGLDRIDRGRRIVRGTIQVVPYYNQTWFLYMLGAMFGSENLVGDKTIFDIANLGVNSHWFTQQNKQAQGFSLRFWKSGEDKSGYATRVHGLVPTRMVWTQPENDRCVVTFDVIGSSYVVEAATGLTENAPATDEIPFKYQDLEQAASLLHFGDGVGALAELNLNGFTLTVDRKIDVITAFLNNVSNLDKPSFTTRREITLDVSGYMEQNYAASGKPFERAYSKNTGSAVICYQSTTEIAGAASTANYACRFDFPTLDWTTVRDSLNRDGILQVTGSARALLGLSTRLASLDDAPNIPTAGTKIDLRCAFQVAGPGDDGDAKYTDLADAP